MDKEDERQSISEFGVLGFVMPDGHSQQGTNTSAHNRKPDERRLGDSPFGAFGSEFVNAIEEKSNDIDSGEIYENPLHFWCKNGCCIFPKISEIEHPESQVVLSFMSG